MSKDTKAKFIALRKRVLYEVMDEAVLETVLQEMLQLTKATPAAFKWVTHLSIEREKCCATLTTKYFICSKCGALSRCEQCMSQLKAKGTLKSKGHS